MKKNIFLITASPLTKNIFERIGARNLSKYFNVYVLDCLPLFYVHEISYSKEKANYCKTLTIKDFSQIHELVKKYKPIFFYDTIGRSDKTIFIQKICKKHNIVYVHESLTKHPSFSRIKNYFLNFIFSKNPFLVRVIGYFINKLKHLNKHISPDFVLMAGKVGTIWEMSATKKLHTASHSYFEADLYSDNLEKYPRLVQDPYILFLDSCLIHSFDFQLGFEKTKIDETVYFSILDKFFTSIEKKYNMQVVIAAHPNGIEISGYNKLFKGREVVFNDACRLSRDCYFAMTHYSSTIQYPILFSKPILLMMFNELENNNKKIQESYKEALSCQIIEMVTPELETLESLDIDKDKYENFINAYICDRGQLICDSYQPLIDYFQE
jgi:hypothetical protein